MSRTFSINCGSVDSLNVWVRCGWSPKALQIRWTVGRLIPVAVASERADAPMRRVARRRLQRLDNHRLHLIVGDPPRCATPRFVQQTGHAFGDKPRAPLANRCVGDAQFSRTSLLELPLPQRSTICARKASPCAVLRRAIQRSSVARSSAVTTNSASGRPRRGRSSSA